MKDLLKENSEYLNIKNLSRYAEVDFLQSVQISYIFLICLYGIIINKKLVQISNNGFLRKRGVVFAVLSHIKLWNEMDLCLVQIFTSDIEHRRE